MYYNRTSHLCSITREYVTDYKHYRGQGRVISKALLALQQKEEAGGSTDAYTDTAETDALGLNEMTADIWGVKWDHVTRL